PNSQGLTPAFCGTSRRRRRRPCSLPRGSSRASCRRLGSGGVADGQCVLAEVARDFPPRLRLGGDEAETAFLAEWLPTGRVLDVCCGYGRHLRGLWELGVR